MCLVVVYLRLLISMGENCAVPVELGKLGSDEDPATAAEVRLPPVGGWRRRAPRRGSMDEEDLLYLLHGSDPVKVELNRLENELKERDREFIEAQGEIKALKLTDRAKEKALAEVAEELEKILEKFQASEAALENKNLEIKRITEEKKEALAAQFAAEATLRRVHAAQKDEELPPIEAILFPLEADIKMLEQEVSKLQDDNRALERITKSKESALLDAEREVQLAKIKAALVDELQNRNQELVKQNDICQEEYRILDRMFRQKVAEVEKLTQNVRDLEEALLSGAANANAVRDYQRQVNELKGEKKILERTLSRVKVTENRQAIIIANEWKDDNDKVMPVKQWLEERRILMGEMQQLREKLSVAERAAKAETQLKEKYQMRLKIIEDSLKASISHTGCNGSQSRSPAGNGNIPISMSNGFTPKKSIPHLLKSSSFSRNSASTIKNAKGASRSFDGGRLSDVDQQPIKSFQNSYSDKHPREEANGFCANTASVSIQTKDENGKLLETAGEQGSDSVSVVLYDVLQKEVVALRKACQEKDQDLKDQESFTETLSRKVETLTKAMEIEAKKTHREKVAMTREIASIRAERDQEQKNRRLKATTNTLI